jgi:hypothetical protein
MQSLHSELESRYGADDDLVQEVKAAIPIEIGRFRASPPNEAEQVYSFRQSASQSTQTTDKPTSV